jgi:hypothetical protein
MTRMSGIGFTGTRGTVTGEQVVTLKKLLAGAPSQLRVLHHGDAVGADELAALLATDLGFRIICHPPDNPRYRAFTASDELWPVKPYLERNRDIVNESTQVIACPKEYTEQLRSGTWATIRYARQVRKPLTIIWPDGTFRVEQHVEQYAPQPEFDDHDEAVDALMDLLDEPERVAPEDDEEVSYEPDDFDDR